MKDGRVRLETNWRKSWQGVIAEPLVDEDCLQSAKRPVFRTEDLRNEKEANNHAAFSDEPFKHAAP